MNFKEALIAHLQGEKVEKKNAWNENWRPLIEGSERATLGQILDPDFGRACEFRLAPRTILVNGVEVPAPESVAPPLMSKVFAPSTFSHDLYSSWCWHNDPVDAGYLERGLVYLDKESAIARAKAMLIVQSKVDV